MVHYASFDVVAEVRDQAGPLASEIAGLLSAGPQLFDPQRPEIRLWFPGFHVDALAKAVQQLRDDLVLAMAPLLTGDARARLAEFVGAPGFKQALVIDNDLLRTGYWVDGLVACVEPLAADLAELVAAGPVHVISRLDQAISDSLRGPDSWGFDYRVRVLAEQIPRLRQQQVVHLRRAAEAAAQAAADQANETRDVLRQFGLSR